MYRSPTMLVSLKILTESISISFHLYIVQTEHVGYYANQCIHVSSYRKDDNRKRSEQSTNTNALTMSNM